jgi:flavin reductase (DIM6/NTAB) family NADH-FMN oxidoreductase RutF
MDIASKKAALRMFTYGMYVVMCKENEDVNGFTANWLTQVSFEPPLLAVSVEKDSKSLPMIQRSKIFTVNVLRSGERELAGKLGKSALKYPEKMADINYTLTGEGYPILRDALSWVVCSVREQTDAGDSVLLVAEVIDAGVQSEGVALTMAEAGYRHAG